MIGMKLERRNHTKIMQKISQLNGVKSVVNLTGRYDILVEVFFDSREELRSFLVEDINKVGGILSSESYIFLDAINKWVEFF
jgi:Lrp/AsnC family transcriptional regulator for asnA, asnC and gidA